jgi:hypothetical protein
MRRPANLAAIIDGHLLDNYDMKMAKIFEETTRDGGIQGSMVEMLVRHRETGSSIPHVR